MIDTTNILANNIVFHIRDDLTIRIGSDGVKIDEGLEIDESAKAIFEGVKEHLGAHQKTLSRSGTIYAAYTNSDRTEGRGFQYPKHYARTRATALNSGRMAMFRVWTALLKKCLSIMLLSTERRQSRIPEPCLCSCPDGRRRKASKGNGHQSRSACKSKGRRSHRRGYPELERLVI